MVTYKFNKSIAGFSAFLACLLLWTCVWTFTSILYKESMKKKLPEKHSEIKPSTESTYFYQGNNKKQIVAETTEVSEKNKVSFWANFDFMPHIFRGMILGCIWATIIAALIQLSSSIAIIFSAPKKVPCRTKYFVIAHLLVATVYLVTFFTPVAYDRDQDKFYTTTAFNVKVKKSFLGFSRNFIVFLCTDLNSYYTFLSTDLIFTIIIMITTCYLMKFEHHRCDSM